MKKNLLSWAAMLLLLVCVTSCSKDSYEKKHTVILSMDGFRWDYTIDAHTPTLDSLRKVGSYSQMLPVYPSNTFPNHYSQATGLHPVNHGVANNSFYDKELGRTLSVFKTEDCNLEGFWGGEPIWNTVELQGGIANIFMWPGSEYKINDRQATVWTPYIHDMDYYVRADSVVNAMSKSDSEIPNLVMWYFPDPDGIGHKTGPNSPECIARVEYIDSVLTYFFAKMRETPYFEYTNFIVTSDHGMTEVTSDRKVNLYGAIDNSKVKYVVSGAPFSFEVEEDYIDEAVAKLNKVGHLRAFRGDAMPERYHFGTHPTRCANVIIIPDMGWSLSYMSEADMKARESRRPRPAAGKADPANARDKAVSVTGSHGYDPFESDMQVPFFGAGPDFKVGYTQESFQSQNIYIILCHLLGVEPSENDGNWDDVKDMFVKR